MTPPPDPFDVLADPDWDWFLLNTIEGDGPHGDDPDDLRRMVRLQRLRNAALGLRRSAANLPVPGLPTVAFCGYGRAGKDTAGKYLARVSPLRYAGSMSWWGKGYVAGRLGVSEQEAWDTRHDNRQAWKDLLNEYRAGDPTRLVRATLARADIVPGVREPYEITEGRKRGLLTHVVWIANPRVPVDFTTSYGLDLCDLTIENDATIEEFHGKLLAWFRAAKIPLLS